MKRNSNDDALSEITCVCVCICVCRGIMKRIHKHHCGFAGVYVQVRYMSLKYNTRR